MHKSSINNETNWSQYSIGQFIGSDQFFDASYQKMGDWIALAIQSRGTGSK
jgi:hypothetical protein